jgi:hypothetical protein
MAPAPVPSTERDLSPETTQGYNLGNQTNQSSNRLSASFGSSPPTASQSSVFDEGLAAGVRAHSIAEQAFTKGLQRLKARTDGLGVGGAVKPASPTRTSIDSGVKRGRTGSHASEDLGVGMGVTEEGPALPVPILENDDVSGSRGHRLMVGDGC